MDCLEFRRRYSTEPGQSDSVLAAHLSVCASCSAFAVEMESVDQLLGEALRLPVPDRLQNFSIDSLRQQTAPRRAPVLRRFAMAAGVLAALLISFGAWRVATAPEDLSGELVAHMLHEPASLLPDADPVAASEVEYVLRRTGAQLDAPVGTITYIKSCPFRNRQVAHMVINGSTGPVTLMLLPHVSVASAEAFEEAGYKGTIVPVGSGSVAIIGGETEPLTPVEELVSSAVAWQI